MVELDGPRLYSCSNCRNNVVLHDDIISKAFQGKNGRALLFSHAMNIYVGPKEERHLMTGLLPTFIAVNAMKCWAGHIYELMRNHRNTRKENLYSRY